MEQALSHLGDMEAQVSIEWVLGSALTVFLAVMTLMVRSLSSRIDEINKRFDHLQEVAYKRDDAEADQRLMGERIERRLLEEGQKSAARDHHIETGLTRLDKDVNELRRRMIAREEDAKAPYLDGNPEAYREA